MTLIIHVDILRENISTFIIFGSEMLMMKYSYGVKPEDKENSCEQNSSAFTSFMDS